MMQFRPKYIILLLSFFIGESSLLGQSPVLGFESPYKCVTNHLTHLNPKEYHEEQAGRSFLLQDSLKRVELAIKLKRVFDGMGLYVPVHRIPDLPDYVDSLTGQHKYVIFPVRLPEIYLEKIEGRWFYSPKCYPDIHRLFGEVYPFGADLFLKYFPKFNNQKILGLFLWQYIGFILVLFIALLLYFLLDKLFKPIIVFLSDRIFKRHLDVPVRYNKTSRVLSLLFIFWLLKYGIALLQLPIRLSAWLITALDIINVVLLSLLAYRIFDIFMSFTAQMAKGTRSKMDDQILPIVKQVVKLLIIAGAILKILILLDINVTALIAGISIGGLALALAAQDTVRNFIGSLMIFLDKPFQVDDWIEIDNMAGTVLEVGFRSTRIQQLDTSIISIPNGIISNKALVNKGLRVSRLFETTIGLAYDTPRHYLEAYILGLREIAKVHPKITGNQYIYLKSLGSYSIDVLFRVYLKTDVYAEELELKEQLLFQMMALADTLGVRFAFPSQTLYIEQFPEKKNEIPTYGATKENLHKKLDGFFRV